MICRCCLFAVDSFFLYNSSFVIPLAMMLFFSNHLVGTEILFYACQNVISLAFFTDIPKEGETHCVFLEGCKCAYKYDLKLISL